MGNRLAKPPPFDRPVAPPRGRNAQIQRPFPMLTPQSYLPGGAAGGGGLYPGFPPSGGPNNFPVLTPNSFLPPSGSMEPPIMNYSGGPSMLGGPGMQGGPNMFPPSISAGGLPPIMPYPNQGLMSMGPQPQFYNPGLRSYSRRRPVRMCRQRRRSRRRRPVIHIIDSSSCSSLSSYSTISSCSRRRHGSHSHSRRRGGISSQQQQQQPIILLPIQCQQSPPALTAPVQNQFQQQPQQIILPPIQIQQPGQFQSQQLSLPPIPMQQSIGQFQQQPLALPPIQLSSSNFAPSSSSSPMIITAGQPMIQPSMSMPQIANIGQMQQGPFQYVQAARQSSSPLQYISAEPRATMAPQRVLVNSTNKRQSTTIKPVPRSTSIRDVPQNDLKFGRRPFDWYGGEKKNNIVNENIRIGQRGSTAVG